MRKIFRNNYFISFGISTIFLLICLIFFHPFYDQADDYYIALGLSNGDKVVYINYFLGIFVSFLQDLLGNINVFSIIQIVVAYFLMVILNSIFISRYKKVLSLPIMILFDTIIAANHFCKVGYTQLSSLCVCLSVIAIIYGIICEKRSYVILGIVIMIIGSFFRFDNIFVGLLFLLFGLFAYFVLYCVFLKRSFTFKKIFSKEFICRIYLPIILIVFFVFGLQYVSNMIYNMDTSFKQYIIQNQIRSNVEDYPILNYHENKEIYNNLSLSENDYRMICGWKIDGAFDNDVLEILATESKSLRPNIIQTVSAYIKTVYQEVINLSDIGVFIVFFIVVIVFYMIFCKFRFFIFPLSISIPIVILNMYLFHIQRHPYRVTYGIWLSAILMLIFFIKDCELNNLGRKLSKIIFNMSFRLLPSFFSIITCVFYLLTFFSNFSQFFLTTDNTNLFKYIENSEKNFAIIGENYDIRNSSETYKNPLVINKDLYLVKCVSWGMVYYDTPFYMSQLNDMGLSNLYWDMIDNKDVLLIDNINCNSINTLVKYLDEHGCDKVTYKFVDKIDEFGVFRIISVNK